MTEQHGGSATVTNAPDGGAVFTLNLPGITADATHDEQAAVETEPVATPCSLTPRLPEPA